MRRLFFDNKVIVFTDDQSVDADFEVGEHDRIDTTKVLQKLENSKQVAIKAYDESRVYDDFCQVLKPSEAAGGLVRNSRGEWLMIFRNGRWDLPKGHVEQFESFAECAEREVEEECGVCGLIVRDKLIVTEHIYKWRTRWILKLSHWFRMDIKPECEDMPMTPQLEEGIEKVEWVAEQDVPLRLTDSFPTIREVFRRAGVAV